jgi:hypothetical protein
VRATSVAGVDALGRARRSVLTLGISSRMRVLPHIDPMELRRVIRRLGGRIGRKWVEPRWVEGRLYWILR